MDVSTHIHMHTQSLPHNHPHQYMEHLSVDTFHAHLGSSTTWEQNITHDCMYARIQCIHIT